MVKSMRIINLVVDVAHLQMVVLLTVRLKILGLIPLVVLLVFVGIRWNIEEELSWPITPDIVPIANNRASYD